MKKRFERLTACALAAAMAGTLLAGCGSSEPVSQTTEKTTAAATEKSGDGTQTSGAKEEPVEMSFLKGGNTVTIDDNGEVTKMIEERFNVDLKGFEVGSKNYQENLNVKFAGGEMPDVMVIDTPAQLATYVEGGIVGELPVEVIREKAPNFAKCADENDDGSLWSTMVYKGKKFETRT